MHVDRAIALENAIEITGMTRAAPPLAARLAPPPSRSTWQAGHGDGALAGAATAVLFCLANAMMVFVFAHAIVG